MPRDTAPQRRGPRSSSSLARYGLPTTGHGAAVSDVSDVSDEGIREAAVGPRAMGHDGDDTFSHRSQSHARGTV